MRAMHPTSARHCPHLAPLTLVPQALDAFLPSAADMAQLCLRVAQAGGLGARQDGAGWLPVNTRGVTASVAYTQLTRHTLAVCTGPAHRYVASVLLQLSALPAFNWVDAASRAVAVEVLQQLIAAPAVSMMCVRACYTWGTSIYHLSLAAISWPSRGRYRTCVDKTYTDKRFRVNRADETSGSNGSGNGRLPPLGCGGGGHWEDAVLTLATAVLGGGGSGGGALVEACLPLILSLAEQLSVNQETADTEGERLRPQLKLG